MAEVDAYIAEAASSAQRGTAHAVAIEIVAFRVWHSGLLTPTERNYAAVRVQVVVEGDVFAYLSAEEARPFMPAA